jgi:hypothetical protein
VLWRPRRPVLLSLAVETIAGGDQGGNAGSQTHAYARGKFYYYAHNQRANWSGTKTFCASSNAFTRLLVGDDCSEEESSKDFEEVEVSSQSKYTVTLMQSLGATLLWHTHHLVRLGAGQAGATAQKRRRKT